MSANNQHDDFKSSLNMSEASSASEGANDKASIMPNILENVPTNNLVELAIYTLNNYGTYNDIKRINFRSNNNEMSGEIMSEISLDPIHFAFRIPLIYKNHIIQLSRDEFKSNTSIFRKLIGYAFTKQELLSVSDFKTFQTKYEKKSQACKNFMLSLRPNFTLNEFTSQLRSKFNDVKNTKENKRLSRVRKQNMAINELTNIQSTVITSQQSGLASQTINFVETINHPYYSATFNTTFSTSSSEETCFGAPPSEVLEKYKYMNN